MVNSAKSWLSDSQYLTGKGCVCAFYNFSNKTGDFLDLSGKKKGRVKTETRFSGLSYKIDVSPWVGCDRRRNWGRPMESQPIEDNQVKISWRQWTFRSGVQERDSSSYYHWLNHFIVEMITNIICLPSRDHLKHLHKKMGSAI